jgi:tetratricopeptide (TPR) repeat protein
LAFSTLVTADFEQGQTQLGDSYRSSAKVQAQVEKLDSETRASYYEYLQVVNRAQQIEAYNRQLEALISSQQEELLALEQQLLSLEETEQAALPLLNDMHLSLQQFVMADLPFLTQERNERIQRLEKVLKRADVSVAEKYRQLLEAYQIEVDYGRSLEAYTGTLRINGQPDREVTFLRLGRVALYYQTSDGQQSGQWSSVNSKWLVLDDSLNWSVQKGIQLALQQAVPELLELPILSNNAQ